MRLLNLFSIVLIFLLGQSCKKSVDKSEIATSVPIENTIITQPCFTSKLTEISPGTYTCLFEGTTLTFKNLRVRNQHLYGDLFYADGKPIMSGNIDSRVFTFQVFGCSGSGSVITKSTRTVSYTEYIAKSSNNTFVFYENSVSNLASFLLNKSIELNIGEMKYSLSGGVLSHTVDTYRFGEGMIWNCDEAKVVTGKLIGIKKGPNVYDYAVANLCYEDSPIIIIGNPL